jgi:hypothetical protein
MVGEPDYAMVPVRDGTDYQSAYDAVRLAMVPAPDSVIAGAIAILEAKCKRGKESDGAGNLGLKVFVSELRKYPADAVLAVLNEWGDANIFAPSWHELKVKLDKATQRRRDMLTSLEWSAKQPKQDLIPSPIPKPSADKWDEAPRLGYDPAPPRLTKTDMAQQLTEMI